ncbi:hypothetical protein ACEZDB_10140 [Streptacidiphilus sp. N1-3]|uniref:Uncharacterized protein n=1 Tax=Streptacidiphilus alkalitolerans TaxID=3342712 RepID=A0ABV6WY93_9ACTN
MGIGYKTAWVAVRDAAPEVVADALGLRHREEMGWTDGTEAAYRQGVFVARAEPDPTWTLAHGRIHLTAGFNAADPWFPDWLRSLSAQLGEIQFFSTDRIGDCHGWARADAGELTRAYYYGNDAVPLHVGDRTDIERELGVGERQLEDGWQSWGDQEWDAFMNAMPCEQDVMRIAERWSVCPLHIPEESVTDRGIHGFPAGFEPR